MLGSTSAYTKQLYINVISVSNLRSIMCLSRAPVAKLIVDPTKLADSGKGNDRPAP